ncbi:hypothetical protein ACFFWD_04195 [Bradyrhizobium erythrophlei]|uniref:hypothetical protein n=1 Tax=Bradyrhizobium erythrophlei TaxID=1437360 RepID=UPI0035EA88E8
MKRRLTLLFLGSAAFSLALALLYIWCFSDILPLASTEPQSIWRFEAAFVVTSVAWIAASVSALSAVGLLLLAYGNRYADLDGR